MKETAHAGQIAMFRRIAVAALQLFSLLCNAAVPAVQAPGGETALSMLERDYRACAQVRLHDKFTEYQDPRAEVRNALAKCSKSRLALAGQFALERPGTRDTAAFVDRVAERIVDQLSGWIQDMQTLPHYRK